MFCQNLATRRKDMVWIIEKEAFSNGDILIPALQKMNKEVVFWNDDFWNGGESKSFSCPSVFHGSLENAARLSREKNSGIVSLCDEERFSYSYIYKNYAKYLLNQSPVFTTIADVLDNPAILGKLNGQKIFARPNNPLKFFSGRTLKKSSILPSSFDYGFYHSDLKLPIVLCEFKRIEAEWRFVCVDDYVITGCEYMADGRKGVVSGNCRKQTDALAFAQAVADEKKQKDFAYVIDVCMCQGDLRLVEMNPFSGSDFYLCDAEKIIQSVENFITLTALRRGSFI